QRHQHGGVQPAGLAEFQRRAQLREHHEHAQHAAAGAARRQAVLVRGRLPFLLALALVFARAGTAPAQPASARTLALERRLVQAARDHPDSFEARYQLASFYLQQKKLRAALPHLERACAIDPTHYEAGHDLALALLETGRIDDARAQATRM